MNTIYMEAYWKGYEAFNNKERPVINPYNEIVSPESYKGFKDGVAAAWSENLLMYG